MSGEPSKVYFTNFRTSLNENLLMKLKRLIVTAGIKNIDFADKYVAIKIHFGEPGNLAYLRPNYAKVVADIVKEAGGKLKELLGHTPLQVFVGAIFGVCYSYYVHYLLFTLINKTS